MKTLKKYSILIFWTALVIYYSYKFIDYLYYSSFKGNDKINFVTLDTTGIKTYGDIFKKDLFKGKVTFVDLYFYADNPHYKIDIPYFKKLYEKFNNEPFQIVYTNEGFDDSFKKSEQKKIVKQNEIWGLHVTVPSFLETSTRIESVIDGKQTTTYPKYMLVDKNGIIVDTFATRPANFEALSNTIAILLSK